MSAAFGVASNDAVNVPVRAAIVVFCHVGELVGQLAVTGVLVGVLVGVFVLVGTAVGVLVRVAVGVLVAAAVDVLVAAAVDVLVGVFAGLVEDASVTSNWGRFSTITASREA